MYAVLQDGGVVPDDVLVELVVHRIRFIESGDYTVDVGEAVEGWMLLNFPQTVQQAAALEASLTSFVDKAVVEPSGAGMTTCA